MPKDTSYYRIVNLPECAGGAEYVRAKVRHSIDCNEPTQFATRYEHTVSEFAEAVIRLQLNVSDVLFKLVTVEDSGEFTVTGHSMDFNSGTIGNGWPMGVLW